MWEDSIKPGAHLLQSVEFSSEQSTADRCQFPACNGRLTAKHVSGQGYIWYVLISQGGILQDWSANVTSPKCDRWTGSRHTEKEGNILQFVGNVKNKYDQYDPAPLIRQTGLPIVEEPSLPAIQGSLPAIQDSLPAIQGFEADLNLFRRIHITEKVNPIKSLEEAHLLLDKDSENARALQFIAWFNYPHRNNMQDPPNVEQLESVMNLLERSKNAGKLFAIHHCTLRNVN